MKVEHSVSGENTNDNKASRDTMGLPSYLSSLAWPKSAPPRPADRRPNDPDGRPPSKARKSWLVYIAESLPLLFGGRAECLEANGSSNSKSDNNQNPKPSGLFPLFLNAVGDFQKAWVPHPLNGTPPPWRPWL